MTVDLNPARARLVNGRLPELVAAAKGRFYDGPTPVANPRREPAVQATTDHDPAVAQLHSTGLSDVKIAEHLGITRYLVWRARQRLNLPSNGRSPADTAAFEADVRRLWEQDLSDGDIAAALGCYPDRVQKARKRLRLAALYDHAGKPLRKEAA